MADGSKLRLRVTSPEGKGRTFELSGSKFLLGRGEEAALRVDDPAVADLHVRLEWRDGQLFATDLGSDEPVTIEGIAVGRERVLRPGEILVVGGTRLAIAEEKPKFEKGGKDRTGSKFNDAATIVQKATSSLDGNAARALKSEEQEAPMKAAAHQVPDHQHQPHHQIDDLYNRKERGRHLPADYAARFLSQDLPESLRPTKESRRLQVALVWGTDQFLEVRDLKASDLLTAGSSPQASFRVYHEAVKGSSPIVQPSGQEYRVLLPSGVPTSVRIDGKNYSADELSKAGKGNAIDVPFKGTSFEIGLNDRVQIEFGNLIVIARYTKPQSLTSRPAAERMDVNFMTTLIILLLCGVAFERMIAITDFANVNLSDDLFKNKDRFAKYIAKAEQKEKPKFEKLSGVKEGAKAKDEEGKFGKKEADKKEAAPSKKGAPVVDVNKREEDRKKVMNSGLLALLGDSAGATSNVFGPGGLGSGLNNALGGINGAAGMGDAAGVGGLGSRGGGSGGGGTALGIGGLGGKGSGRGRGGSGEFDLGGTGKAATQFVPGKTSVMGGLTADEVGRIIRRHWNEIKYCYEKELNKDPNLYGKVAVYFEIGPVGDVTVANIRESTMNNGEVEGCMLSKVKLWKFPSPRGGGVVQVNYPFIFKQG